MNGPSDDPSDPVLEWRHSYINHGKQDATGFKLVIGTIDGQGKNNKVLDTPEAMAKVEREVPQTSFFKIHERDFLDYFVVCLIYDDERGHHSEPRFYALQEPWWHKGVHEVTEAQRQALSSGFSCTKFQ